RLRRLLSRHPGLCHPLDRPGRSGGLDRRRHPGGPVRLLRPASPPRPQPQRPPDRLRRLHRGRRPGGQRSRLLPEHPPRVSPQRRNLRLVVLPQRGLSHLPGRLRNPEGPLRPLGFLDGAPASHTGAVVETLAPRGIGTLYLVANCHATLRFSPRFMVAHNKHRTVAQRKQRPSVRPARTPKAHTPSKHRSAAVGKRELPKQEEALKAAGLAKEEAIKPEEVKAAVIAPVTEHEEVLAPPERERSSYDGDTAIKLYLREIGLVKLLTPEEEIQLAARIKKGDKKAREQMIKANQI